MLLPKKLKIIKFDDIYNEENKITNFNPIKSDKSQFADDGIYSEKIFGSYNEEENEKDIGTLGWIDFGDYYIINPIMYGFIKKCIPNINNIINYQRSINQNGEIDEDQQPIKEGEYIGLIKFKENFLNILEKSVNKEKNLKEYNFILKNKDKVFINKFPVFSHKLRPATMIANHTLVFTEINNEYNFIIQYINEMNDYSIKDTEEIDMTVLPLLYQIQKFANIIFNKIINDYLKGKKGFLRKNVFGGKMNFTARDVITPLIGYNIDEVAIPYITFAELYKFQLINLISKIKNINYNQALEFWKKSILGFNEEFYNYMMELVKKTKYGCTILLNRNPTISLESILFLKIAYVKKDYSDYTLSISNSILSCLSADYDGKNHCCH